jgi:hypothetical protein
MSTWDTNVALAFAAEELLFAAQAITSDSIPQDRGLGIAHYRVRVLSENGKSLPPDIARRVAVLDANFADRETSGTAGTDGTMSIVAATLDLLGDVRNRLADSQHEFGS